MADRDPPNHARPSGPNPRPFRFPVQQLREYVQDAGTRLLDTHCLRCFGIHDLEHRKDWQNCPHRCMICDRNGHKGQACPLMAIEYAEIFTDEFFRDHFPPAAAGLGVHIKNEFEMVNQRDRYAANQSRGRQGRGRTRGRGNHSGGRIRDYSPDDRSHRFRDRDHRRELRYNGRSRSPRRRSRSRSDSRGRYSYSRRSHRDSRHDTRSRSRDRDNIRRHRSRSDSRGRHSHRGSRRDSRSRGPDRHRRGIGPPHRDPQNSSRGGRGRGNNPINQGPPPVRVTPKPEMSAGDAVQLDSVGAQMVRDRMEFKRHGGQPRPLAEIEGLPEDQLTTVEQNTLLKAQVEALLQTVDAKNAQIQELQNRPQEVTRLRHHRDSNTKYSDHAVAADSWGSKPNHKAASSSHTRSKTLSLGSQSRTLLGLEVPDGLNSPKLGQQQTRPVPEDSGHQKEPKSVL